MDQIRVRTQDEGVGRRPIPITHTQVSATSEGAANTILTVGAAVNLLVKRLTVCNITASAATFSLNSVPSGGSIGDGNAELRGVSIPANTASDLTDFIGQFYEKGATLEAYSDTANALVVHGWAEEIL